MKIYCSTLASELELFQFTDSVSALKAIDETIDVIITDYQMPEHNGLELSRRIREKWDIPIIVFTGQGSEEIASKAFPARAICFNDI